MSALTAVPALLLGAAVKGAVLVLAVAAVILFFRVRSATTRHAFWTAVVLAHLAIPALLPFLPGWHVPLPSRLASLLASLDRQSLHVTDLAPPAVIGRADVSAGPRFATTRPGPARAYGGRARTGPRVVTAYTPHGATRVYVSGGGSRSATIVSTTAPAVAGYVEGDTFGWLPRANSWLGPALLGLWLVGALAVLVRLALGTTRVALLARDATRVVDGEWLSVLHWLAREVGITRPLTMLRGTELVVPVTWGVVYPKILLPSDANEWTAERRRHVLLHELAHVRRFDALTQLLSQLTLALFWFDPFVWYAVHRMRVERERACDDLVIRHGALPSRYAGDLLDLVQTIGVTRDESVPAFAALAMARRHDFEGRMLSILDPDPDRRPFTARRALAVAGVAALLVIPLAAMRPYESEGPSVWPAKAAPTAAYGAGEGFGWGSGGGASSADVAVPAVAEWPEIAMDTLQLMAALRAMPSVIPVPAVAPAPAIPAPEPMDCDLYDGSGTQTSIHSNSDDADYQRLRYLNRDRTRCASATLDGRVEFSKDEGEITWLSRGGRATFEERVRDGVWRSLTISERGGGLERTYLENGEAAAFDMQARAWMHAMVQEIVRETGYRAAARVERIRRESGVNGVLSEIARIHSTGAKRAYFTALLDGDPLNERDLEAAIRQAGRELESSGDLSAFISKVPMSSARGGTRDALAAALEKVESDGDKANTISALVSANGEDRELLLVALRAARTIESDGDCARVLTLIAPMALAREDDSLRAEFFRAVRSIESDGDTRRVLSSVIREGRSVAALTLDLVRAARRIESDGDKSAVLTQIATAGLVNGKELTQEFLDAARTIESDGDYRRVMEAVRSARP